LNVENVPLGGPLPEEPVAAGRAVARLAVTRLTLTDFRCYARQRLETDPRPVVLTGPNGAGKTNLLEAVSFLAPGRGLRGARLADVARRADGAGASESGWSVAARLDGPGGPIQVGTGRAAALGRERRTVRIDGQAASSQAALGEAVSAVWLTPRMDRLFNDGPGSRRRFLDRLVFAIDPAHAGRVAAYDNGLRQRARLLRDGGADGAWLDSIEATMAAKGIAVAAARADLVNRLGGIVAEGIGPFPGVSVGLTGDVDEWLAAGPALAAEDRLRAALAAARRRDTDQGAVGWGPQRSDLDVRHAARGVAAAACSTGEQKALLIAIVLAHARLLAGDRGCLPLLLLDEVAAHLDGSRREALFEEICGLGIQAWLSGTDAELFAPFGGRAQHLRVEDAAIRPAA
jgi:DNA replication and repair protein RecF